MRSTGELVGRWPRAAAAVSFGAVGSVIPATWFLPSVLSRRDGAALLLFVVFPGAAATLAGGLVGAPLCDPARIVSQREAVIRGVGVATLAWVIFAPMFAAFFAYTPSGAHKRSGHGHPGVDVQCTRNRRSCRTGWRGSGVAAPSRCI